MILREFGYKPSRQSVRIQEGGQQDTPNASPLEFAGTVEHDVSIHREIYTADIPCTLVEQVFLAIRSNHPVSKRHFPLVLVSLDLQSRQRTSDGERVHPPCRKCST